MSKYFGQKLIFVVRILLFGLVIYMLFRTIKHQPQGIEGLMATFLSSWQGTSSYFWIALLVLMVLNWTLESWKWRTLLEHIEPISIAQAFKSVLTGLALGMLLPSGTGDVAGRIINLKKKTEGIGAGIVSGIIQTIVTLSFGYVGLVFIVQKFCLNNTLESYLVLVMPTLGLVASILFWYSKKLKLIQHKRIQQVLTAIFSLTKKQWVRLFTIGMIRHLVFILQFCLLFNWAGVKLPFVDTLSIVNSVFLAKTIIPALNFVSDLGVRELSAIYFMRHYAVDINQVITATFSLWLLNIGIPVLIGSIWILFTRKNAH
ncbi:lysylphosphatidylglycerol synthase transmembrane domain-containing protein [Flectobacillus rhizosphaerae]|uniref:Lysylphosphatidylglycerol synthase transmembrane domain-containing protein n=2 Tax=Flectobacillus roseus TaxID=502259 RepID=A0ABT6Y3W9_9BACT|nr:lysylphosphatidylglycerol synthase transmembrane domain-containing protein [Flectobacillus roseus]MDI9858211.1 lysylphosphatidylglycerol synthase transmembrane domain-containing protein [Flectobacillus roseus]